MTDEVDKSNDHDCTVDQFPTHDDDPTKLYDPNLYKGTVLRGLNAEWLRSIEHRGEDGETTWKWEHDPTPLHNKEKVEQVHLNKLDECLLQLRGLDKTPAEVVERMKTTKPLTKRHVRAVLLDNRQLHTMNSQGCYEKIDRGYAGFGAYAVPEDDNFLTFEKEQETGLMVGADGSNKRWYIVSPSMIDELSETIQAEYVERQQAREEEERRQKEAADAEKRRVDENSKKLELKKLHSERLRAVEASIGVGSNVLSNHDYLVSPEFHDLRLRAKASWVGPDNAAAFVQHGGPLMTLSADGQVDVAVSGAKHTSVLPMQILRSSLSYQDIESNVKRASISRASDEQSGTRVRATGDDLEGGVEERYDPLSALHVDIPLGEELYTVSYESDISPPRVNIGSDMRILVSVNQGSVTSMGTACQAYAGSGTTSLAKALQDGTAMVPIRYTQQVENLVGTLQLRDLMIVGKKSEIGSSVVSSDYVDLGYTVTTSNIDTQREELRTFFGQYAYDSVNIRQSKLIYPNAPSLTKSFTMTAVDYGALHAIMHTDTGLSDDQLELLLSKMAPLACISGSYFGHGVPTDKDPSSMEVAQEYVNNFLDAYSSHKPPPNTQPLGLYRDLAVGVLRDVTRIGSDYHIDGVTHQPWGVGELQHTPVDSFLEWAPRNLFLESNDCDGSALLTGRLSKQIGLAPYPHREYDIATHPHMHAIRCALVHDVFSYCIVGATGAEGSNLSVRGGDRSNKPAQGHAMAMFTPVSQVVDALVKGYDSNLQHLRPEPRAKSSAETLEEPDHGPVQKREDELNAIETPGQAAMADELSGLTDKEKDTLITLESMVDSMEESSTTAAVHQAIQALLFKGKSETPRKEREPDTAHDNHTEATQSRAKQMQEYESSVFNALMTPWSKSYLDVADQSQLKKLQGPLGLSPRAIDGTVTTATDLVPSRKGARARSTNNRRRENASKELGLLFGYQHVDLTANSNSSSSSIEHAFYMHLVEMTIPAGVGDSLAIREMGAAAYTYAYLSDKAIMKGTRDGQMFLDATPQVVHDGSYALIGLKYMDTSQASMLDKITDNIKLHTLPRRSYGALQSSVDLHEQQTAQYINEEFQQLSKHWTDTGGDFSVSDTDLVLTYDPRITYNNPHAMKRMCEKLKSNATHGCVYTVDLGELMPEAKLHVVRAAI